MDHPGKRRPSGRRVGFSLSKSLPDVAHDNNFNGKLSLKTTFENDKNNLASKLSLKTPSLEHDKPKKPLLDISSFQSRMARMREACGQMQREKTRGGEEFSARQMGSGIGEVFLQENG